MLKFCEFTYILITNQMINLKYIYKFGFFWLILLFSLNVYTQVSTNLEVLEEIFVDPVVSCLDTFADPAASILIDRCVFIRITYLDAG